jgi:hypothetical protein
MILHSSDVSKSLVPFLPSSMYSPRYTQPKHLLISQKRRKYAYYRSASRKHNDDPEVELLVGPVVGLAHDDAGAGDGGARHGVV